jgi:hypothetical protein
MLKATTPSMRRWTWSTSIARSAAA